LSDSGLAASASPVASSTIARASAFRSRGFFLDRSGMTKREYTQEEHEAARRAVEQLFRDVAARFPDATVRNDLPAGPNNLPVGLELRSSVPGTTQVSAVVWAADEVDLYMGDHGWAEIWGRPDKMPARVRRELERVVTGQYKEWIRGRRIRYRPYGPSSSN